MGFILGLIKQLIKLSLFFLIFVALIVLIPNLPPYTSFTSIKLEATQPSIGPLAPNGLLNNAEKLYKGKLYGPEAFQVHKGELYTSLATGEIVKLSPAGHVTFVTKIGQPCVGLLQEHICGRPLGFQIDAEKNVMYVADPYYGIWKVDLKTDKKQLLVSPRVKIAGRKPMLFNSIALGANGDFYWTDSSSDFLIKDGVYTLVTDPSGRLFHYNAAKNESRLLLDNLWFANGVAVSPDNQFVVVAETNAFRLQKYYLNGPKKGRSEIFTAGLPGTPDNVRALPDGSGVLVGLYTVFDDENPLLTKSMSETPIVRKFIARLMRLIEIPFEFLNQQYPHILFEEVVYFIGHFKSITSLASGKGALVQIDWDGKVVATYYSTDGSMQAVCDGIVFNDKLYLGAPHGHDYVGSVPAPPLLKKAFSSKLPDSAAKEVPKQTKPAEQAPKQTQEKPKVPEKKDVPKVDENKIPPKVEEKKESQKAKPQEPSKPTEPSSAKPQEAPKPTVPPKAKPQEAPKPTEPSKAKPQEAPKPTEPPKVKPQEAPKPTEPPKVKPQEAPKPTEPPKAKPQEAPKPTEPPIAKPQEAPKPIPSPKPIETPKAPTPKPVEKKPEASSQSVPNVTPHPQGKPQQESETKPPQPKQSEAKPKTELPTANTVKVDPNGQKPPSETPPKVVKPDNGKPAPEQIPIKEEIPSDTIKPSKETLKVIKKGGPTEIPNPNL